MYDMLFEQVKAATEDLDRSYKRLLDIIDNIIRKTEIAADAEYALLSAFGLPSASFDISSDFVGSLMRLKNQLHAVSGLCNGIVSRINHLQSPECRQPRIARSNTVYFSRNELSLTSSFCRGACREIFDKMESITDTLHCLKRLPDSIDEYNVLLETMDAFFCDLQKLHSLQEEAAECYQLSADSLRACEKNAITSFECAFDKVQALDIHADQWALMDVSSTEYPVRASSNNHQTDVPKLHNGDAVVVRDGKQAPRGFGRKCCRVKATSDSSKVELSKVRFSAIAPKTLVKGEYSLIEIVMYEDSFRNEVERIIADFDGTPKETKSGLVSVEKGARIKIMLSSPDLVINDNTEEMNWCGDFARFTFPVEMPIHYLKPQILFVATVYINDVIATRLKFVAKCKAEITQNIEIARDDILSAFVSYASQDRYRVAMIVQGMKKARPDMDIFFDVESLRSGDDWESAMWTEIDKRDILFLCWSHFAKESKWVNAEWRYAMHNKGVECIEPVPIETPDVCPPPDELKQKHFNDKLLYIISSGKP